MTNYTEGSIPLNRYIHFFIAIILMVCFVRCEQSKTPQSYIHLAGKAQGTTFSIVYFDSLKRDFTQPVDSLFRVIDKSASLWDSTSNISNFNKNTPGTVADQHFINIFQRSMEISQMTEGAFDVTVSPLVARWGFYYKKNAPIPDDKDIKNLLTCCGWHKVRLEKGQLIKQNPCIQLDFNAIAQGYTVDLMAQFLENKGVSNYMVEIGGEVRTLGKNETGESWRIGIDKPVENSGNNMENDAHNNETRPLEKVVLMSGKSLATSGSYRKFILRDGKKYSHMIDPLTGYPIQHNLLSASVIADNCMDADALATAFMVMGLEKAKIKAIQLGVAALFIYQNDNQQFEEVQVGNF